MRAPVFALVLILTSACGRSRASPTQPLGRTIEAIAASSSREPVASPWPASFDFELSDAPAPVPAPKSEPKLTPLSDADLETLLRRLPSMPPEEARSFAFRTESLKPPRAGKDTQTPFPPPATIAPSRPVSALMQKESEPLEVLRASPVGPVGQAPVVTIAFSAPMIPLSSVDVISKVPPPATISPKVTGSWRWLDVSTVEFRPETPFPSSTRLRVVVPKGARSALGNQLPKPYDFAFETPRNTFLGGSPDGDQNGLEPTLRLWFQQALRAEDARRLIRVRVDGRTVAFHLAPETPLETQQVALRLEERLQPNSLVSVSLEKGIPSTAGPLRSEVGGQFAFRTYPPLTIRGSQCLTYDCTPTPGFGFRVELSNPLEPSAHPWVCGSGGVDVSPPLEDCRVLATGGAINILGTPQARTSYEVKLPVHVKDVWKQALTGSRTVRFTTTELPPPNAWLSPTYSRFVVLDPDAPKTYEIESMNHDTLDVELYRVRPLDYPKYEDELLAWFFHSDPTLRARAKAPGTLVQKKTLQLGSKRDERSKTSVDLSPALTSGRGQALLIIRGADPNRSHVAWIQSTALGATAYLDQDHLSVFVSALKGGAPISGARVQLAARSGQDVVSTRTDRTGLAAFPFHRLANLLVVETGEDTLVFPRSFMGSEPTRLGKRFVWYVIDDRALYRPGESVRVKGWLRGLSLERRGDLFMPRISRLHYRVQDVRGVEVTQGETSVDVHLGFDLQFALPDGVNLGSATLQLSIDDPPAELGATSYAHSFQIQEFRRPEFEVAVETEGPYVAGDPVDVATSATYYSGGPLPLADTQWTVSVSATSYSPPGLSEYHFGRGGIPNGRPSMDFGVEVGMPRTKSFVGKTDKDGHHRLRIGFPSGAPHEPLSIHLRSTVVDVNRQAWAGEGTALLHPSSTYLGLRSPVGFVEAGDPIFVDTVVSDPEGSLLDGRSVTLRAFKWRSRAQADGQWIQEQVGPQLCSFTSTADVTRCVFHPSQGGTWVIRGEVREGDQKRVSLTETQIYVAGPVEPEDTRSMSAQQVQLWKDKDAYEVGDTAKILVQSPWPKASGVATIIRSGILRQEVFVVEKGSYVLEVPIEEAHLPRLSVRVDLYGETPRVDAEGVADASKPTRAAWAQGTMALPVRADNRTLQVTITPQNRENLPGAKTWVDVQVTDANGNEVPGASVALLAVDEAVLALANYVLPDPTEVFHPSRVDIVTTMDVRESVEVSGVFAQAGKHVGGVGMPAPADANSVVEAPAAERRPARTQPIETQAAATTPIAVRTNFGPLLRFEPRGQTDARGRLEVELTLADSLTR